MTRNEELGKIIEEIQKFPPTFKLRAYPGRTFMLSAADSYVSSMNGMMLYTLVQDHSGKWVPFVKGTPDELRREIIPE